MNDDLALSRSALSRFEQKLAEATGFNEDLAHEYDRLRRALATSFQSMALDSLPTDQYSLDVLKGAVVGEMARLFEGRVDSQWFTINRYRSPHPVLYALLASRAGEYVPSWRLRVLSGDKVHTERRVRELRDLGLSLEVREADGEPLYRLDKGKPDLTYAAAFQLRENSRSKRLSPAERAVMVRLAEQVADLPERRGK